MNLFVGNLDFKLKEEQLQELFAAHGTVDSVKIITDKYTRRSKGFAFVEMPNESEANSAIEALNGKEMGNRPISVSIARPREERG